jgi:hypothetical protein
MTKQFLALFSFVVFLAAMYYGFFAANRKDHDIEESDLERERKLWDRRVK